MGIKTVLKRATGWDQWNSTQLRTAAILASVCVFGVTAMAQQGPRKGAPPRDVTFFNCSLLKGKPLVCLMNETDDTITDIDCEGSGGFFGSSTKGVPLPKGGVGPHSFTIIDMRSCKTQLNFSVVNGPERQTGKVDTDTATIIEVPPRR